MEKSKRPQRLVRPSEEFRRRELIRYTEIQNEINSEVLKILNRPDEWHLLCAIFEMQETQKRIGKEGLDFLRQEAIKRQEENKPQPQQLPLTKPGKQSELKF